MATQDLYIVKQTIFNPKLPFGSTFNLTLPATFTDLQAAKRMARTLIAMDGYDTDFLPVYDVNNGSKEWKHGDGVLVYAEGPSGEHFKVEIDTVPDLIGLHADDTGRVDAPLYHVLLVVIEYDKDRSGSQRFSVVEGTHTLRQLACEHALRVLLDEDVKRDDFVEYVEYKGDNKGLFGEDVMVHAVKEDGQNMLVSVVSDQ